MATGSDGGDLSERASKMAGYENCEEVSFRSPGGLVFEPLSEDEEEGEEGGGKTRGGGGITPLPSRPPRLLAVLSVDGGGVRDAIPTQICVRLEAMLQERCGDPNVRLADFFDLFAGTSGGGLLALMLTAPHRATGRPAIRAQDVADFWTLHSKHIFRRRFWPRWAATLRNIWRPKYKVKVLEQLLRHFLRQHCGAADLSLSEAVKPLLLTSYDISAARPYFFLSLRALSDSSHDFPLIQASYM
ncbi:unnamed protein product [Closterium sp. Yama58-4]|nr:unnamed protein product [Closterium sp. Yama58-4]